MFKAIQSIIINIYLLPFGLLHLKAGRFHDKLQRLSVAFEVTSLPPLLNPLPGLQGLLTDNIILLKNSIYKMGKTNQYWYLR